MTVMYQIKIYNKMLTPKYDYVGATNKFTSSDTVFASFVIFFIYVNNRTT